ncbi:serine/threonine-protein phosphatase 6 regulatory subunit 3-A-like [Durio zibethinus]|uniref:Serine/threonine-protein phosphatase 6 regulatory subunit 3-A-like n=1 Tax=Durio zibethinus TaxID=66656 RepID=A0A6P5WKG6_DURZI|nr:serine/threonine-protein phosphatase 6 regulatory subunit 3-A-like [Durio zibethinus]
MFWRMAGLSTASPVEPILDKENFTPEELLDEDEIIQECKALNGRLINFVIVNLLDDLNTFAAGTPTRNMGMPSSDCQEWSCSNSGLEVLVG